MPTQQRIALEQLLTHVAEYGASDLHMAVGNVPVLRLDGKLVAMTDEEMITPDAMQAMLEHLLTPEQQAQLEKERNAIFTYALGDKARFKINVFYQKGYPSASLRVIPPRTRTLSELGLPSLLERFTKLTKGLVIVSGPFGSGRSSTLAALVDTINQTRAEYILTVEKPIEHLFVNEKSIIEQREVGKDTPSFEAALDNSMQEDVNVIMLSELESPAVIAAALRAAQSGRLVLASMNTDSAVRTVEKIITSFPAEEQEQVRTQLSGLLEGIVSQRLLPRVGGGTIVVAEVLTVTQPVRSVIRDGAIYQIDTLLQTSREEGMMPLDRALADRVKAGEINLEDAVLHAKDAASLKRILRPGAPIA